MVAYVAVLPAVRTKRLQVTFSRTMLLLRQNPLKIFFSLMWSMKTMRTSTCGEETGSETLQQRTGATGREWFLFPKILKENDTSFGSRIRARRTRWRMRLHVREKRSVVALSRNSKSRRKTWGGRDGPDIRKLTLNNESFGGATFQPCKNSICTYSYQSNG